MRARLGDSKKLVAHGNTASANGPRRRAQDGARRAREPRGARARFSLARSPRDVLRAPCPSAHAEQCWSAEGETFVADEGLVRRTVARDQQLGARSARDRGSCAWRSRSSRAQKLERRIDERADLGRKARHDRPSPAHGANWHRRCLRALRGRRDRHLRAGGGRSAAYLPATVSANRLSAATKRRARKRSASIRCRAWAASPSCATPTTTTCYVSMASLVGKWVRDLLMARVVRYHRADDPGLPATPAGYHDPVTTRSNT